MNNNCTKCNYLGCTGKTIGHIQFHAWLYSTKLRKHLKSWIRSFSDLNYKLIDDIELDGIDTRDYPDFCDAFIKSATYKGRDMTEKELERLNEDGDYVHQCVMEHLY